MCVCGSENLVSEEHPRRSGGTWTFAEALASSRRAPSDPCLGSRPVIPKVGSPRVHTVREYICGYHVHTYVEYNTSTCILVL